MASYIPNGNGESPPQLDEGVVKVVVVGEPKCGKSSFIKAYHRKYFPGEIYSHNAVRVYPCEFESNFEMRRVSIFEIPGHPDFLPEHKEPHYNEADVIVFVYAIDDPSSLQKLKDRWMPETNPIINTFKIPTMFIGTKADLRDDPRVIERLAKENKRPLSKNQGLSLMRNQFPHQGLVLECSAKYEESVISAFETIFFMALKSV